MFGNGSVSKPAQPSASAPKRKPRQPKKEPAKPKNRLDQTFRTTKSKATVSLKDLKTTTPRKPPSEAGSSDLSSPIDLPNDFLSLPSLRPKNKVSKPVPLTVLTGPPNTDGTGAAWRAATGKAAESAPTTPTDDEMNAASGLGTISPISKPKSMGHLID
jgi:NAD-dependent histone deacetylase SIR2